MSYTPGTTFADGNALLASQVQGNIKGIRDYLNGGVAAGDLQNAQWVDTKHLMKGEYNSYNNTMNFVSGVCGGHYRTFPADLYSMMTRSNTDSSRVYQNAGANNTQLVNIPWQFITNTAVTINIPRACKLLLVQYSFLPGTPYVDDTSSGTGSARVLENPFLKGEAELYIGEGFITQESLSSATAAIARDGSRSQVLQEDFVNPADGFPPVGKVGATTSSSYSAYTKWKRLGAHGFHMLVDPAVGTWSVGLMGRSQCVYTKFIRWSMSVEAWLE